MRHAHTTQPNRARLGDARRATLRWLTRGVASLFMIALCWVGWRESKVTARPEVLSATQVALSSSQGPATRSKGSDPRLKVTLRATRDAQADLSTLKSMLAESISHVERRFGLPLDEPLKVTLCDDPESMRQLARAEQGWAPPEWANGLAYPQARVIYLHRDHHEGLKRTLEHELAHIALAELRALPLWLNEGLAVWASERVSFERMKTLTQARLTGELIPISTLNRRFPASPSQAQLAYAQSAHFVTSLADEHGEERLRSTLQSLSVGEPLEGALHHHLGQGLGPLEARWRATLTHGRLEGLSSLAQEGVPMALGVALTLLIGLALWLRKMLLGVWHTPSAHSKRVTPRERLIGVKVRREPGEPKA